MRTLVLLEAPIAVVRRGNNCFEVYETHHLFSIVKGSYLWSEPAARDEEEFGIYYKEGKPFLYTVWGTDRFIYRLSQEREVRKYLKIIKTTIKTLEKLDQDLHRLININKLREVFYEGNYFPEMFEKITIEDSKADVAVTIYTENLLLKKFLEHENLSYIINPDVLLKVKVVWENYLTLREKRLQNFLSRKDDSDTTVSIEDIIMAQHSGS